MKLSIAEICWFTVSTPSCRNSVEGERVLHAQAEDKKCER